MQFRTDVWPVMLQSLIGHYSVRTGHQRERNLLK